MGRTGGPDMNNARREELESRLLRGLMARDAKIWAKHNVLREQGLGEPDKIDDTKKRSDSVRDVRQREARAKAGALRLRPIKGRMLVTETGDRLTSPTAICAHCRLPYSASPRYDASLYCSQLCRQRAKAVRAKLRAAS